MLIEFQLDTSRLLNGFRNRFRAFAFCAPEFPVGPPSCGGPTFLDHIDIHDTTALRRSPGPTTPVTITKQDGQTADLQVTPLQLTQPITAHLVRRADLPAAGTQAASSCYEAEAVLVFDLTVEAAAGSAELCIELADIELAVADPTMTAALQSLVNGQLPATCSEFDLAPLEEMTGSASPVVNAGLSANGAFEFVAIRLEVQPAAAGAVSAWANFHTGTIGKKLFGTDWSVFVDKDLILPSIVERVAAGIAEYNDSQWFDYNVFWGPNAEWSNPNDAPRVTVKVDGEQEQACVCFLFPQDIEIELDSVIDLSVSQPDQLTTVVSLDTISHDDFSIACCAETNMLGWAVLGPHWLDKADSEEFWGAFLLGWGFLPAVFFGTLVMAGDAANQIPIPSPSGATCTKDPDDPITTCTQPLALGDNDLLGHFTVTSLKGLPNGPLLLGTLTAAPTIEQAGLSVDEWPFEWYWADACGLSPHRSTRAVVGINNTSSTPALAPLKLCQWIIVDDPPQGTNAPSQYTPWVNVDTADGAYHAITVEVPEAAVAAEYLTDPWPLRLLIVTSAGVREITVDPIVMLTEQEKEASDVHLQIVRALECKRWLFKPKWSVDPGPVKEQQHLWHVVAKGLHPDESIAVRGVVEGAEIATVSANGGLAQLSALIEAVDGGDEIEVAVGGHGHDHEFVAHATQTPVIGRSHQAAGVHHHLEIKELQLLPQTTMRVPRPTVGLAFGRWSGLPVLACATDRDVRVYDVTSPALPRLVWRERWPGARGIALVAGRLIAWGTEGLCLLGPEQCAAPDGGWPRLQVHAGDIGRGKVFALGDDTVQIYDAALRPVGHVDTPGASSLAVGGRTLFVAIEDGLATYSLDQPERPAEAGFQPVVAIDRLTHPVLPNATESTFVRLPDGGGVIVYASSGRKPVITARFASDPWFLDVVHSGRLAARPDASRMLVTILASGLGASSEDGGPPLQPITNDRRDEF